jgi:N-acetylmuramoyl-L-alanine amidase
VTWSDTPTPVSLRLGSSGEAVRDLQRRLTSLGFGPDASEAEHFGPSCQAAVRGFQTARGLHADGVCGPQTWAALVEAGYRPGDRLLYHRRPMLRGDDVADLQRRLCALGFDTGRVDGIFGPDTETALRDFQRNAGLTTDGVCGRDTLATMARLGSRTAGGATIAELRQREALQGTAGDGLAGRLFALGEHGGLDALVHAVGRQLTDRGATVLPIQHPDSSTHATRCNDGGAVAYLGFDLQDAASIEAAYFSVPGFTSVGGRRLADLLAERLPEALPATACAVGMRLPVLRETRMPAVQVTLGPPPAVVSRLETVATRVAEAVEAWTAHPVTPPDEGPVTPPDKGR